MSNKYLEKISEWQEFAPGVMYDRKEQMFATTPEGSKRLIKQHDRRQIRNGVATGALVGAALPVAAALSSPKQVLKNPKRLLKVMGVMSGIGSTGMAVAAHFGNKQFPRASKINDGIRREWSRYLNRK